MSDEYEYRAVGRYEDAVFPFVIEFGRRTYAQAIAEVAVLQSLPNIAEVFLQRRPISAWRTVELVPETEWLPT
jgi:hypothetical protein